MRPHAGERNTEKVRYQRGAGGEAGSCRGTYGRPVQELVGFMDVLPRQWATSEMRGAGRKQRG